jgi:hypothetical protein
MPCTDTKKLKGRLQNTHPSHISLTSPDSSMSFTSCPLLSVLLLVLIHYYLTMIAQLYGFRARKMSGPSNGQALPTLYSLRR